LSNGSWNEFTLVEMPLASSSNQTNHSRKQQPKTHFLSLFSTKKKPVDTKYITKQTF